MPFVCMHTHPVHAHAVQSACTPTHTLAGVVRHSLHAHMQYMEALVECRKQNPWRRYAGECNDITYQLTKCLGEEKKIVREPRQKKYAP